MQQNSSRLKVALIRHPTWTETSGAIDDVSSDRLVPIGRPIGCIFVRRPSSLSLGSVD